MAIDLEMKNKSFGKIRTALVICPHFVQVEEAIESIKKLKRTFPDAQLFFTGNEKNMIFSDFVQLQLNPYISKLIIYGRNEISLFNYLKRLRKKSFDAGIILLTQNVKPTLKSMLILLLSNPKWKAYYLMDSDIFTEKVLSEQFLATNLFFALTVILFILISPVIFLIFFWLILPLWHKSEVSKKYA